MSEAAREQSQTQESDCPRTDPVGIAADLEAAREHPAEHSPEWLGFMRHCCGGCHRC
jgi:hypothetical protein